ncbi:MAG: murein biosynthesis integral membrane protein MurJ [Phototrophicaceae bacterium]
MSEPSTIFPDDSIPEPSEPATQEETNASVAGATGIIALGNIASRILGLAREKTLAYFFGASPELNAFRIAVLVPQSFYDLLIGGHVNGAIVPVLTEIVTIEGREELWKFVNILFTLLLMIVSLLVIILELFAPQIVGLAASGFEPEMQVLATNLLRITSPALIFLALFAIFSGTLYSLKSFTYPAFAGVMFNASIVLAIFLLVPASEISFNRDLSFIPIQIGFPASAVTAAAIGWLIGSFVQMALQMPGLQVSKLRISFNWRHPALKNVFLLYTPVMASLLMDTFVIRFFSYDLASRSDIVGSINYMIQPTTLIQFPQGLVATAISIAILPTLATQATSILKEGVVAFRDTLGLGLRLATTLIIPATLGLLFLAVPIVRLLFEGGEFTPENTEIMVLALRLYLIGLPFAAIDLILVYAFYARKDTLTPALIGLFSHGVYIVVVLLLFSRFGLFSLMIADSIKHIVHAVISAIFLGRQIGGFGNQRFIITALKTVFAASIMALIGWVTLGWLTDVIGTLGIINQILLVMIPTALSGSIFLILAYILRIDELRWLLGLVRQRLLG